MGVLFPSSHKGSYTKQSNSRPELKEQIANTWYNVDDPQTHNIKLKKLEAEDYILCDPIYVKF